MPEGIRHNIKKTWRHSGSCFDRNTLLVIFVHLFILAGLTVSSSNPARWIFFLGVVPVTFYGIYRLDYSRHLKSYAFLSLIGLLAWLSLNSLLIGPSETEAALQTLRRGILIAVAVMAFTQAATIWLEKPGIHSRVLLLMVLLICTWFTLTHILSGNFNSRLSGTGDFLSHPIEAPSVLLILWVIGIFLVHTNTSPSRIDTVLAWTTACSLVIFTLFSQSRGPLIALLYSFALLSLMAWHKGEGATLRTALAAALAAAAGAALTFWLHEPFHEWIINLLTRSGTSFRPEIWHAVVSHSGDAWMSGYGTATAFAETSPGEYIKSVYEREFVHSHNLLTELFVSGGILALLLFTLIVGAVIRTAQRGHTPQSAYLAAAFIIGTAFMINLTDTPRLISSIRADWIMLWLPLAFSVAYASARTAPEGRLND